MDKRRTGLVCGRKVQSITFPITGYRDYDDKAAVVKYPQASGEYEGYVWFNGANGVTRSYHLKYHRNDIQGTGDDGWKNRQVMTVGKIEAEMG